MFGLNYLKNVATLKLEQSKCTGCNMCIQVCPHAVFDKKKKKVEIIRLDHCMECGACRQNCPEDAISVDSGVGCAAAVITGMIKGTEPVCGCSGDSGQSGCC